MRYFLLLAALGLLFGVATAAPLPADTAVLRINRLPADGLLLNKGWRYHAGDDPAWARPDFDDRGWDTLNPTRPRPGLPPAVRTGMSWLRLHFRPGDSLRQYHLLLQSTLLPGACEIYLNGQLVQRLGRLQADLTRVRPSGARRPSPIEVPGAGLADVVLAVRYAPWHSSLPLTRFIDQGPMLQLSMISSANHRQASAELAEASLLFYVAGGVAALLMLLHLAFFYFNPAQRANWYFTCYAGALAVAALLIYYGFYWNFGSPEAYMLCGFTVYSLLILSELWTVRALYALFGFRRGWVYTALWLSCGGLLTYQAFYPAGNGFFAFLGATVLATIEQLRLTGRALRQRQRGAWIIATGFGLSLLVVFGLVGLNTSGAPGGALTNALSFVLIYLPPALGISLFLAREFALDAELLQVKLGEVERLSAQTLAQEQDKQALLAAQNDTLEHQVAERTGELQRSLTELRATQAQLIQKEKMASLGELTAGIAHEIQNPLNFVNNFADVSAELMAELREALATSDTAEATALAEDVTQNLGKIHQHGQRAAGIVRGMLEHSRASTGERQPTDVNALADEYLRLAYQGLRAKDKTFNAALETDFAPGLPLVEAVAGDLGRVLLNLFSNAFYAVQQRQRAGEASYQPTVGVATRRVGNAVEVRVSDNGTGMPAAVQAKIFQPFFTTKPTGEGTGLGLSLSHDIIAQGHGGTLRVESQSGQGTTFFISLSLSA
ncbi:ATP-binding protein [Hymenobacter caeli]|uniref:histidine kinase n=1 Tax=Hymenobacter caeli TaxID=2735894 RepID=A0ABX2FVW3_9BACT|nr:ATP-binding protein [Hymenobacter caeli]NRT21331.1 signal transduction histidine kinase [Hymenobacter caeli]